MTHRISRFAVLRTSATFGALYGAFSLIIWLPGVLARILGPGVEQPVFVLGLPIFAAVAGLVLSAIYCLLFNFVARWTGGIEFTLEETRGR